VLITAALAAFSEAAVTTVPLSSRVTSTATLALVPLLVVVLVALLLCPLRLAARRSCALSVDSRRLTHTLNTVQ
jgi:hypothetical protein